MKRLFLSCLVMLLAQGVFAQDAKTPADICAEAVPAAEPETRTFSAPEQVLEPGVDYRAVICTEAGAIYVDLLEAYSPLAVNSFVFLAEHDYFNNTTFHRVLQNFMAQGGDPTATGTGGPGYQFENEQVGFLHFDKPGWLAMANAGRDTNGSQFFITTVPYSPLDFNYTIFGEVLEGQENVENISLRDPDTATEPGMALNTVVIVTDPSTVETTYQPLPDMTREEIQTLIDNVNSQIPPSLLLDTEHTGVFDTEFVSQTAPDALRSDYAAFLEEHNHEYRVSHRITNADCDLESIPYMAIGITLDRFATPEDAAAALTGDLYTQIAEVSGYAATEVEGMDFPVYTQPRTACEVAATDAITMWQRGHFVVTAQALFPAESLASADRWLSELVGISYESLFSDILRPELR
jgi:cyclophilin family peptidyl-prolyl cis-trans isomerase